MELSGKKIILGSASPRRQQLMRELFGTIEVRVKNVPEEFPDELSGAGIAEYLAGHKAGAFDGELLQNEILVTADTIVWYQSRVLNKPADREDAMRMLRMLNGQTHEVFTGVCIKTAEAQQVFSVQSWVRFRFMREQHLQFYVDNYKPFDKAGSYGAQECLTEGMNPLSDKEKSFLTLIGKPDLFERSLAQKEHAAIPLIERIEGSYFNVMGLPVVELYEALVSYTL